MSEDFILAGSLILVAIAGRYIGYVVNCGIKKLDRGLRDAANHHHKH